MRGVALTILASFALAAHGCMPMSSGEIQPYELSSTPKFRLNYSPPTSWTVGTTAATQGQAKDAQEANDRIKTALNDAFSNAFTKLNLVGPSGFSLNLKEFVPVSVDLTTTPTKIKSGDGVVELGVVSQVCKAATGQTCDNLANMVPLILNNTIIVEKGPILSGTQWHDLADEVYINLSSVSGVYIQGELVAEKN